MAQHDELSDVDRAILDFEGRWWRHPGAKEAAIREQFDMSATRYFQRVNALVDQPAALVYAPSTVLRLQRLRRSRRAG